MNKAVKEANIIIPVLAWLGGDQDTAYPDMWDVWKSVIAHENWKDRIDAVVVTKAIAVPGMTEERLSVRESVAYNVWGPNQSVENVRCCDSTLGLAAQQLDRFLQRDLTDAARRQIAKRIVDDKDVMHAVSLFILLYGVPSLSPAI